jgi:hypothetical protein
MYSSSKLSDTNMSRFTLKGEEILLNENPNETTESAQQTNFIFVGEDGLVSQQIAKPMTSNVFARFKPNIIDTLSQELTPKPEDIEEIIRKRVLEGVEKALREKELTTTVEQIDSATTTEERTVEDKESFSPFFNEEFFSTIDCFSNLKDDNLELCVELANLIEGQVKIYPFGHYIFPSGKKYSDQSLNCTWKSDDNMKGLAKCHLSSSEGLYTISILRVVYEKESGDHEEISFDDIPLPATFFFKGKLSR